MAFGTNNAIHEVRVVAREMCSGSTKIRLILEPHLTHLAERQDKAETETRLTETRYEPRLPDLVYYKEI